MQNARILSAVLNKWLQPAVLQLTSGRMDNLPFLASLSNKIRSTGWVSPQWSLGKELSPLLGDVMGVVVEPMIMGYLQGVPDESLPKIAHSIADNAIKQGGLSLMEGNVVFELEDLEELKRLLNWNLPLSDNDIYQVKTKEEDNDEI